MNRSHLSTWLALLLVLVPDLLLIPCTGLVLASALLLPGPQHSHRIEARLRPLALLLLLVVLRQFSNPQIWTVVSGWMMALVVVSTAPAGRIPWAYLGLSAVVLQILGLVPSPVPALALLLLAGLDLHRLTSEEKSSLGLGLVLLGLQAALARPLGQTPDLEKGLREVGAWWASQLIGLDQLRAAPLLGVGPSGSDSQLNPLLGFVVQYGWLAYGLLAWSAIRIGWQRLGWPTAIVLGAFAMAQGAPEGTLLRLAPLAGLVLAQALGQPKISPRPRWTRLPMGKAIPATVAACLLTGGLVQGASDFFLTLGDAAQQRLDWTAATKMYERSVLWAPSPRPALERLSDLRFRAARYRDGLGMQAAAEPLHEVLRLGLANGWTWYRLAEIEAFSGDPRRRMLAFTLQALELNPGDARIRVSLGHRWLDLRQNEKAVEAFRQAIQLEPGLLPRLFRDLRRVTTNGSLLRRLLSPGNLDLHLQLARLLEQSGLVPVALQEFEGLLASGQASVRTHLEYADLLSRSGRLALAEAELRELSRWTSLGPRDNLAVQQRLEALGGPTPSSRNGKEGQPRRGARAAASDPSGHQPKKKSGNRQPQGARAEATPQAGAAASEN